jgi:flagellar hook-associated protein 2
MATDFLGALGAGSGLNSKNLVESLVAAERAPQESRVNSKIADSEQQISAYGTVLSSLQSLETSFGQLNDATDFATYSTSISGGLSASGGSSFEVTTDSSVQSGRYEIAVTNIAEPDRWVSAGFDASDTTLNDGTAFNTTLTFADGTTQTIAVETATPAGMVSAINAASVGVTASLVDTGSDTGQYKVVLTGSLGADNAFTVSDDIASGTDISFPSQVSTAADAALTIDGVAVTRSSNTITDLIDGATIELLDQSSGTGVLSVTADTQTVEDRIRSLVQTYNSIQTVFSTLRNPDADDPLAGALSGDNTFRTIENQVRQMFTGLSSTPGESLSYLSDIGVEMTRFGTLEIDDTKLSDALTNNYTDVITMLSADTTNQTMNGAASRGIAGDALYSLDALVDVNGPIRSRTDLATQRLSDYQDELAEIDLRMQAVYDRYLKQFTAMEQIVDQMNSTRESLKQQLDALPFNNRDN